MTTAVLLLAAGQSRRFGTQDKLLADLHGIPLVVYSARALRQLGVDLRLAVVTSDAVSRLLNREGIPTLMLPQGPQSASITAGVASLRKQGATRILIALGDMPLLRSKDFRKLLDLPADLPACAWSKDAPIPPAVFPSDWFDRLESLTGDKGAGSLLRSLPLASRVTLPSERLIDIDHVEDLRRLTRCAASDTAT